MMKNIKSVSSLGLFLCLLAHSSFAETYITHSQSSFLPSGAGVEVGGAINVAETGSKSGVWYDTAWRDGGNPNAYCQLGYSPSASACRVTTNGMQASGVLTISGNSSEIILNRNITGAANSVCYVYPMVYMASNPTASSAQNITSIAGPQSNGTVVRSIGVAPSNYNTRINKKCNEVTVGDLPTVMPVNVNFYLMELALGNCAAYSWGAPRVPCAGSLWGLALFMTDLSASGVGGFQGAIVTGTSTTPWEPTPPPVTECSINGDMTLDHGIVNATSVNGVVTSTILSLMCSASGSAKVQLIVPGGGMLALGGGIQSNVTADRSSYEVSDSQPTPIKITSTLSGTNVQPGSYEESVILLVNYQ